MRHATSSRPRVGRLDRRLSDPRRVSFVGCCRRLREQRLHSCSVHHCLRPADSRTVEVVITNDGCAPAASSYTSGPLTFKVSNKNATGVTEVELLSGERIIGEKENLAPGFSGTFALALSAGEYTLYCPGATTEKSTFKVTGGAVSQAPTTPSGLLAQGTKDYAQYVKSQVAPDDREHPAAGRRHQRGQNLNAAQAAYGKARAYYERIEPVAESFTNGKRQSRQRHRRPRR